MQLTEAWVQEVIDRHFEDVELIVLEEAGNRRSGVVRLYIDRPDGVSIDLCAQVSNVVGTALDEANYAEGPYTLEVSSPGIERPLAKRAHFETQLGKKVHVKTHQRIEGQRVFEGVLRDVREEGILLAEGDREVSIGFDNIARAHLVFDFD